MKDYSEFIRSAEFISADPEWDTACPLFAKTVGLKEGLQKATLVISALGVYTAYIDGRRVGDDCLTPGWTEYRTRLQYQTYDVTDMIKDGSRLVIGAGHGWFASRIGTPKTTKGFYGDVPAVIAALVLEYKDGTVGTVRTDESWETAKSPVLKSQIYDGEEYDASLVPVFSGKAHVFSFDKNVLIPQEGEFVREVERVGVKEIIVTPKGETVLDFGQNITGCLEFTITGKAGTTVTVGHAEILDKDGNFYTENYRSAKALVKYTLKDGTQTYKAHHTFYGFRYVRLGNWCEEVRKENFTAIVMHSDMKRTGYFKCGHEKINKLYENIVWGQRDNFLDVPTDCPQRDERLGWTGDAEVFCRTASINFDTKRFFTKWMRDLRAAQWEDGGIPHVVPDVLGGRPDSSAAWGDVATVLPFETYVAFGDKALLEENYPMMEKWVEYIHSRKGEEYLWQNCRHFGDWLGLDAPAGSYKGSTDESLIASAYFYLSCTLLVKAGKILGRNVSGYEEMCGKIKEAFTREYIRDGKLTSDTQTAYVLAIHFGLVDDVKPFADRLIELIEEAGDSLKTGFVGTPYLLDTLTEIGRPDKAYTLLVREEFPSWLFSVNMGATTVWEHWDGLREDGSVWSKDMNSFNHYAYGSVASWMFGTAAGIKPDENEPAYKHIFIKPLPDKRLGSVKARIDTVNGTVVSEWKYEDGGVRYSFTVPKGCRATVEIDGITEELAAGKYTRYGKE